MDVGCSQACLTNCINCSTASPSRPAIALLQLSDCPAAAQLPPAIPSYCRLPSLAPSGRINFQQLPLSRWQLPPSFQPATAYSSSRCTRPPPSFRLVACITVAPTPVTVSCRPATGQHLASYRPATSQLSPSTARIPPSYRQITIHAPAVEFAISCRPR